MQCLKNITEKDIEEITDKTDFHGEYQDRKYRIRITRLYIEESFVYTICLFDETDWWNYKIRRMILCLWQDLSIWIIMIEAMESVEGGKEVTS